MKDCSSTACCTVLCPKFHQLLMNLALVPVRGTGAVLYHRQEAGAMPCFALLFVSALILLMIVGSMIVSMSVNSRLSADKFGWGFLTGQTLESRQGRVRRATFHLRHGDVIAHRARDCLFRSRSASRSSWSSRLRAASPAQSHFWSSCSPLSPLSFMDSGAFSFLRHSSANMSDPWFERVSVGCRSFEAADGIGLLTGGIILAIMITPIISAVVRDVLDCRTDQPA